MTPLDPGARRAILDAARGLEAWSVERLSDLVRRDSTLGREAGALELMAETYRDLGLSVRRVPTEPAALRDHPGFSPPLMDYAGRDNVVGLHEPREVRGRSLALQGHVDVVPVGAEDLWLTPPFEPSVRDGRLYGRGSGDMKAGIVAYLTAFEALRRAGLRPAAPVQMQSVIEEECTGNGALATMLALPRMDAVVIPEPGPGMAGIYAAEVGVVWAWVTVTGRPAHVRDMQAGVNAIEAAMRIVTRFKEHEGELNRAERVHPAFRGLNHPVNVNLGTIEGGEWNSSVPTRARVGLRVGVMLGRTAAEARADIERIVAEAASDPALRGAKVSLEFRGFLADPCQFDMESDVCRLARRAYAEASGQELRAFPATGLTDGRHFELYQDTRVACFGPEAQEIHGIDESVSLASMHDVTRAIALLMAEWCGVERA